MASSPIRGQDQNCCFLTKHSEGCAQVKHGGAAIVAALAAIALVAGVLLILAQNGYNLAGINSIAQMVEAKWVYLGMGIAGALLVIDTTLIIAQVKSYLNQTIPQDELEKRGHFNFFSRDLIGERLAPKSYALLPAKANDSFSTAYAIAMKNEDGEVSTIAYHTQEEADVHLARLQEEGYVDGVELENRSHEYQPTYMEAKMGPQLFQRIQSSLSGGLSLGMLRAGHFVIDQTQVRSLAVHTEEGVRLRFFNTEAARETAIRTEYTDYLDQDLADRITKGEYGKQVKVPLQPNEYWTYDYKLVGKPKLYCVAYGTHEGAKKASFISAESRDVFIAETLGEDAVDAEKAFNASSTYTMREVLQLVSEAARVQRFNLYPGQYESLDLQMAARNELHIYALKVDGEPQPFFFKTEDGRQKYIDTHLQGKIDQREVCRALYGFEHMPGVLQLDRVDAFCQNVQDYWPCIVHVNGKQVFALLVKETDHMSYAFSDSQEFFAQSLQINGPFGASKGFVNAQVRDLQTTTLVEHVVTTRGDYWCEHTQVGTYVFYREGSDLAWVILSPVKVQTFLNSKELDSDAKEKLASEEYPHELGIQLAKLGRSREERSLLQSEPYLAKGEYVAFNELKTNVPLYPSVFMIMIKTPDGDIQFHYFRSDQARSTFIKKENLRNGYVRDRNQEIYIKLAAPAIYKEQSDGTQKPLLFTFEHPDHETTCFMFFEGDGKISKEYIPASKVADGSNNLQASVYITPDVLAARPLGSDELQYLEKEIRSAAPGSSSNVKRWFEDKELKEKQYVIRPKDGGYIALLIRNPDAVAQKAPQFEVLFYRPNSPQYHPKLAELETQGYKNAEAK